MKRTINRTTPIKDRRTVGYVYGGTQMQRMIEYSMLKKKYGCYMRFASPRKNKELLDYIRNGQSGNGVIISFGRSGRVFESVV